jgi:hypothetical protein
MIALLLHDATMLPVRELHVGRLDLSRLPAPVEVRGGIQLIRRRETLAQYQDARCCIKMLRIMRQDDDRGVVAASSWPKFGRRDEEHHQRGVCGLRSPGRQPLFGVGTGLVGPDTPLQRVAPPIVVGARGQKRVDLRQPDCRALTVSGPVGGFYRRVPSRDGTASLPPG